MKKIIEIHNIDPDELTFKIIQEIKNLSIEYKHELLNRETSEWLTRKETAELLKVSLVTLHNWSKNGILQAYKIGNRVRYRKDEIEKSLIKM